MIKEIKYDGYTATPSDYEVADGDLATAIGVVPEDGTLKPILQPAVILELDKGDIVKYIHETSAYRHYILHKSSGILSWMDKGSDTQTSLRIINKIHQITGIGNTLVVLSEEGMHYFLWKGEKEGYLYLGTHIPECPLSFGLQGEFVRTDEFELHFDHIAYETDKDKWENMTTDTDPFCAEFSDTNKKSITDQVLAKVNKFIADNSVNKGKFIYPFLLRYAYRLYDGSLSMHSAPILMICSSDLSPDVSLHRIWSSEGHKYSANRANARVLAITHTIDYAVINPDDLKELMNWKDIIHSVDIFVSSPIYTYDQNGECTKFLRTTDRDSFSVCRLNQKIDADKYPVVYQKQNTSWAYCKAFDTYNSEKQSFEIYSYRIGLPRIPVDTVKANIRSCAHFYYLESIKIEQLSSERTTITVEEDYLQSLVTRQVMTDDYDSHDTIIPQYSFAYNGRLNLANLKKMLFRGHKADALLPYSNGYVNNFPIPDIINRTESIAVYVLIKQDGKEIAVRSDYGTIGLLSPILYLYYPNANAYKAVIERRDYTAYYYEVPLEKHEFLNGAFYFGGWDDLNVKIDTRPVVSSESDRTINISNKIYTSEVNNPFHFPLLGINTVGTGTILGISSAAKALSEGQFGQFPLYAFTSDGVWALEVSSAGSYAAKQPITRDVCINAGSITQIDSAVLFATDRGIMLISGSQTQCITDTINAPEPFSLDDLPKHEGLIAVFNAKAQDNEKITTGQIALLPFLDFLAECRMIYDYTHQHIIVYNPDVRYAYVYSLKSHSWGMMISDIDDNVNSYPEALAMSTRTKDSGTIPVLVDFTKNTGDSVTAMIITRPVKLDDPNIFKTINTIIQRGIFKREAIRQVLYGSNDLYNWHVVWSSSDKYMRGFRGTPYKAFRLALICRLNKDENIFGCSVQYDPRMLNRPR